MKVYKIIIFVAAILMSLLEGNAFKNFIKEKSYSASTEALKRLLDLEDLLEENLGNYLEDLKDKLKITQQALDNFKAEEFKMRSESEEYLSNPLNSFALIRHQQQDWDKWAVYMTETEGNAKIEFAHRMRSELPTAVDLQDASRSIELLITYYNLDHNKLVDGNLPGYSQPEAALSSMDCYALGKFNIFQRKYTNAEIWINASLAKYDSSQKLKYNILNFSETDIEKWLGILLIMRKEDAAGMWHMNKAKTAKYDHVIDHYTALNHLKEHCAASFHRPTNLHCRYNNSTTPFLRIAPLKMEELSTDPLIVIYHNVVYDSEIEWFLNTDSKFSPALLEGDELSSIRTAKDIFFTSNDGKIVRTIEKRLTDMTGFMMEDSDDLSLINYGIGGHYDVHDDAFDDPDIYKGNRIATALIYMGDVELGGATIFPKLNLTITPMRRTALVWHNLHNNGTVNRKTLHGACPVIVGAKYVVTKWIYDGPQMFIKPCQANHSDTSK